MRFLLAILLAMIWSQAVIAFNDPDDLWMEAAIDSPKTPMKSLSVEPTHDYLVQPGDLLAISVWRESDLQGDVVVRPDGKLSFPLVGEVDASGKSIEVLRREVSERIGRYVPDAMVTIMIKQIAGNKIYVVGKVNRPGEFVVNRAVDVMQALSLAGGATAYAALDDIVILRRQEGAQVALPFNYDVIEKGTNLEQNIVLQTGDTVVVP